VIPEPLIFVSPGITVLLVTICLVCMEVIYRGSLIYGCHIYNQMTTYKFPVILGFTSMDNEFLNRKWFQSGVLSPFSLSPVMHTNLVIINPHLC